MKITSHCESHFDNYEYGTWPFHVASFCCRMFGCFAPATLIKMIHSGLIWAYFVLGKRLAPVALIGKKIQSGFGREDSIEDKSIVLFNTCEIWFVYERICLWVVKHFVGADCGLPRTIHCDEFTCNFGLCSPTHVTNRIWAED